jgi:hypothetical protein
MVKAKPKVDKEEVEVRVSGQRFKFWSLVISGILGTYATVMSTVIQSTSAKEDSVKTLVTQMNDRVIPGIQDVLDTLSQDHYRLCERVAKIEGREEAKAAALLRHNPGNSHATVYAVKPEVKPEPKDEIKLTPPEELFSPKNPFRKQELPRLDLDKPEEESAE